VTILGLPSTKSNRITPASGPRNELVQISHFPVSCLPNTVKNVLKYKIFLSGFLAPHLTRAMGDSTNTPVAIGTAGLALFVLIQFVLSILFFNGTTVKILTQFLPYCKLSWKSNWKFLGLQSAALIIGTTYSAVVLYYNAALVENTPETVRVCTILNAVAASLIFSFNFIVYQFLLLRAQTVETTNSIWEKRIRLVLFAVSFSDIALVFWSDFTMDSAMIPLSDGVTFTCTPITGNELIVFYALVDIVMNVGCLLLFSIPLRRLLKFRRQSGANLSENSLETVLRRNLKASVICVLFNFFSMLVYSFNDDISLSFIWVLAAYTTACCFACLYATSFGWKAPLRWSKEEGKVGVSHGSSAEHPGEPHKVETNAKSSRKETITGV
jgi:hypothetical protein